MSSLRFMASPMVKDLQTHGAKNIIPRCAWFGGAIPCNKRPFSGNTRSSMPLLRASTESPVLTMDSKNMSVQPASCAKCVTYDNMNPAIKVMEYAVRGPLVIRAGEIEKELEKVRIDSIRHNRDLVTFSNVILIDSKSNNLLLVFQEVL